VFKLRTSIMALAAVAAMAAVPAHAAPVASAVSVVSFENFKILWSTIDGGRQVDNATDFSSLSVTASLLTAANMTGMPGVSMNPSSSGAGDFTAVSTRGIVDPSINSASGVITANQVFNVPTLPLVGNFSHSVANDTGAPILNFPNATTPATANADLHSASYASLDTLNGTAGTSSSSQLSSTQVFQALVGGDKLKFSFDIGAYVGAFLSSGAAQSASADWSVSFTLINTSLGLFDPQRSVLNAVFSDSISNNFPGSGTTLTGGANSPLTGGLPDLFSASLETLFPIIAGDTYQLTANISSRVQVERQAVPEPGGLALVGLSLAALALTRRRKTQA